MKAKIFLIIGIAIVSLWYMGCKEEIRKPLVESSAIPESPSNIVVENRPGGALINYTLPDDPKILYVLARFSSKDGVEREVKSSVYKNQIVLDGFADTIGYKVKLYCVDRSENWSVPVITTINPLKAPVHKVYETLSVVEDFGGINISFTNEKKDEFTLFTMVKDSITHKWVEYNRLYTQAVKWTHKVRGLPSVPTDFAIFFIDKWKNSSDTLFVNIKPLLEVEFDYSLFVNANLADDAYIPRYRTLATLWLNQGWYELDLTKYPGLKLPVWFTVDVGKKYRFGRMKLFPRNSGDGFLFNRGNPKTFQIWATNNPTTNWKDWTLIGDFEIIKPSGLPMDQVSQEDRDYVAAGVDFSFIPMNQGFRYFRFKTLTTWGGGVNVMLQYFQFWGQVDQ